MDSVPSVIPVIALAVWWYALSAVKMPLPVKILAWIAGALIFAWTLGQAIEWFVEKYKQYGPRLRSAAHNWSIESPFISAASVALVCALLTGVGAGFAFHYWAKTPPPVEERPEGQFYAAAIEIKDEGKIKKPSR